MNKYLQLCFLLCFFAYSCKSGSKVENQSNGQLSVQRDIKILSERLHALADSHPGKVGIAVIHIENGDTLTVNNNHRYPMQSVYKFPIALAVLNEVDHGRLTLGQQVHVSKRELKEETWSPMAEKYGEKGFDISLRELLAYMVSQSDNIACDVLLDLVKGPAKVHQHIEKLGPFEISIKSTEKELHHKPQVQFENYSSPLAMSQLLKGFYEGKYLSDSSKRMLTELMLLASNHSRLNGMLPEEVEVAHKTGTSGRDRNGLQSACNDAGIITLPDGNHIALTVFVSNSKEDLREIEKLIALIGRSVYEFYSGRMLAYFEEGIYRTGSDRLPFRLLSPLNEDPSKDYPLLIYLHGSGARGDDNMSQLSRLPAPFTDSLNRSKYPCYLLVPQCPKDSAWVEFPAFPNSLQSRGNATAPAWLCLELIKHLISEENIDASRIYLTGYSMGGEGTFELANRFPALFACAVPLAAVADTSKAVILKDMPVWAFHGAEDNVNELKYIRMMVESLKRVGGKIRYTELPGVKHNCQNEAYNNPELWDWMFSQNLK